MKPKTPVIEKSSTGGNINMNHNGNSLRDYLAPLVAISALAGFAVLTNYMLKITTTDNENHWNRTLYIFSGVEAIAFGAAGFFFGSEVQRRTVEKAEGKVQELQNEASNGKALAAVVKSLSPSTPQATASGLSDQDAAAISIQQAQIQQIKELAEKIYPTNPTQ